LAPMVMATTVMNKASRDITSPEALRFVFLSKQPLVFFAVFFLITVSRLAIAESIVTPTFEIEEVFVDNNTDDFSETGRITQISPGVIIISNGAKADFSMAYSFDATRSHDLERGDRESHRLDLNSEFRHKPEWTSYANANNRLTNGDIDGVQSTNPDVIDNNSEQLFIFDAGTTYSERLTRDIQYSAGLQLDYANQQDSDSSSGQSVALTMDNNISENKLTWEGLVQSRLSKSDGDDERVDILGATFNYKFDQTLSAFVELGRFQTDSSDLDENKYLVGLRWSPTRQSFISAGMGELGDDKTYELDASITKAHTLFTAQYTEKIEALRDQLFDERDDQFGQSTQTSTSIDPVLRKRGDVAVTQFGVRSSITFSVFYDETSDPNDRNDERTKGAEIEYDRKLSSRSSLSLSALTQETEFNEKGNLDEYTVSYQKSTSEKAEFEVFASYETFDSTDNTDEYDQTSVGAAYRIAF
jgi:hypothetical protein